MFPHSKALPFLALLLAACLFVAPVSALAGHHEKGESHSEGNEAASKKAESEKKQPRKKKARDPLRDPSFATETAPKQFRVEFDTTQGKILLEVNRAWAPNGADRFYNLVKIGYFEDIAFFRVIDNFMAQFGMHGNPKVTRAWSKARIRDDAVVQSNLRGFVSFAKTAQPNSRTTQLFINLGDNVNLDGMGFAPFAKVIEGMDVVDKIYKVGEGKPRGPGPAQQRIKILGNTYLKENFPQLDYLKKATLLE